MAKNKLLIALLSVLPIYAILDINQLTLDEKIGQMIVVATISNPDINTEFIASAPYNLTSEYIKEMICQYHVGGVLFMGANFPHEQAAMTNTLQELSKFPLFIFQDTEWGLSMRMPQGVIVYPKAMTLGALSPQDDPLIEELGYSIGKQNTSLGIHSGLFPVCDVNTNPKNPIINTRSFGENSIKVAQKATLIFKGLARAGCLACAKHWPAGHGDMRCDPHHTLPYLSQSKNELKEHLLPFEHLIQQGIPMIMNGQIDVPALTQEIGVPGSLSRNATYGMLRETMGFHGLIITDGLGMKGVTNCNTQEEIAIKAVQAGNDILLCPLDVPKTIQAIKHAIENNIISELEINEHVTRILSAKKATFITQTTSYNPDILLSRSAFELKKKLYTAAITLVHNKDNYLPLASLDTSIPVITIADKGEPFITELQKHISITHYNLTKDCSDTELNALKEQLAPEIPIIISLHLASRSGMIEMNGETLAKKDPPYISFINDIAKQAVIILFGNPYNLELFHYPKAIIVAYENEPESQLAAALTLVGKHNPRGQLPVSVPPYYKEGTSYCYA